MTRGRSSNLIQALSAMLLDELRPVLNNAMEMKDWRLKTAQGFILKWILKLRAQSVTELTALKIRKQWCWFLPFLDGSRRAKNKGSCLFHKNVKEFIIGDKFTAEWTNETGIKQTNKQKQKRETNKKKKTLILSLILIALNAELPARTESSWIPLKRKCWRTKREQSNL